MINRDLIEKAAALIIEAVGENPCREGLVKTPTRIASMYEEFLSCSDQDPSEPLSTSFEESHGGMVVLKDIPFYSICEHHFLPFHGKASIGYLPNGRVVGLSKLARTLDIIASRPQLQERLTQQFADVIQESLNPKGVGVIVSAEHMCLSLRGARKPGSKLVTSASRGMIQNDTATQQEFDRMLQVIWQWQPPSTLVIFLILNRHGKTSFPNAIPLQYSSPMYGSVCGGNASALIQI